MIKLQADILIITNEQMGKSFSSYLQKKWKKIITADERRQRGGEWSKKLNKRTSNFHFKKNNLYQNESEFSTKELDHLGIISITSEKDLETFFDSYYCKFHHIFITPELGWNKQMSEFEGYEVAENLINTIYKEKTLQLKFLSFLSQKQLHKNAPESKMAITESFPHLSILDMPDTDELFDQYSNIHFELIKNLSTTLKGRLAAKEHQFGSVYNNIIGGESVEISKLKEMLIGNLQDFKSIEAVLDIDINKLTKQINSTDQYDELVALAELVRSSFVSAEMKNGKSNNLSTKKFNYSVCIIEDDAKYLSFLSEIFGSIFKNVYPNNEQVKSYDLKKLRSSIEEISNDYDVFILDLLYQDGKAWHSYNGLELYDKIQRENPYAVIRIVTNLPREIISRISEKMVREGKLIDKIPLSSIFTKSRGDKILESSILDRSDEIVSECRTNEKKKSEGKFSIPTVGVFGKPGVKKHIQHLLKNDPVRFGRILDKAYHNFELFKKEELHRDTLGWSEGELPGPNTFSNNWQKSALEEHLPNILTHRLMILSMMDSDSNILDLIKYERKVSELVKFNNFHETHYLTTRLGFGKTKIDTEDIEKYSIDHEKILHVKIHLKNLFIHENEYLSNEVISISQKHVKQVNEKLFIWLKNILTSYNGAMGLLHINRKEPDFKIPYYDSADEKSTPEWEDVKDDLLTIDYVKQLVELINKYKGNKYLKKSIKDSESAYDKIYSSDNSSVNIPKEILKDLEESYISVY